MKTEAEALLCVALPRVTDEASGRIGPPGEGVRVAAGRAHFFLVDQCDAERVGGLSWHVGVPPKSKTPYISRAFWGNGSPKTVYLHRYILSAPPSVLVDHKDGDGLDNRRATLRIADPSQSNTNIRRANATGFVGVYRKNDSLFYAEVQFRGKRYFAKRCSAEAAAHARDAIAREVQGEFAVLNFPGAA